jgi:hypothetical protein
MIPLRDPARRPASPDPEGASVAAHVHEVGARLVLRARQPLVEVPHQHLLHALAVLTHVNSHADRAASAPLHHAATVS